MAIVRIPSPLRRLTDGRVEVEVSSGTVRSMIDDLEARFPGLAARLLDDAGHLHRHVHVFVGEADVRSAAGLDTRVAAGDVVSIVPAVAGG